MPLGQVRGTQVQAGTLPLSALVSGYVIPTANLVDGPNFLKRDGSVAWTADQNANSNGLTGLRTPTAATDAAPKGYVDSLFNGFDPKPAANVASNTNVATLSGVQTIDGVTGAAGMRVLLLGQTTASQNGVWIMNSGAWTRPADWTGASAVTDGAYVFVEGGTQYGGSGWIVTTTGTITVDTTAVAFSQFKGAQQVTAGAGINVAGNTISAKISNGLTFDGSNNIIVQANGGSLNVSAAGVKIADAAGVGYLMLSNASNAATFAAPSGDVASVSAAGAFTFNSAIRRTSSFVENETPSGTVDGSNVTFTLANTPVAGTVKVYVNGVRQQVGVDYTISAGAITFATAPYSTPVADKILVDYQK